MLSVIRRIPPFLLAAGMTMGGTMRAIGFHRFGGPEVVELLRLPVPVPGHGQVRIAVRAAGLNPTDAKVPAGVLDGVVPHTFPVVLGWDVAGVVDEVRGGGPFRRGDDVVAFTRSMPVAAGALADYVAVGATAVARKPASLGWTEAAVLPLAGLMADQLVEALDGAARQRVLVLGAAGGVGTFTTQLLAARGAEVLGTASADEFGHLREFGVGVPLDRTRPLAGSGRPGAIDAALDTVRALRGGAGGACKTAVEMR